MLTRAFTCSRNLSQEFAVSRSRPTWVAVVMGRDKKKTLYYFHRCVKAVESNSTLGVSSAAGFLTVPGAMPLVPRARPARICRPAYCRSLDRAGLSLIELRRASEKCAKVWEVLHTACTSFPQTQNCHNLSQTVHFCRDFSAKIFAKRKSCTRVLQPG